MKTLQELELTHKYCKTCNTYKLFSEFSPHRNGSHNLYSSCKDCHSKQVLKRYHKLNEDPEYNKKILEEARLRSQEARLDPLYVRPSNKKYVIRNNNKNPEKLKARQAIDRGTRNGSIAKLPCVICGDIQSEGHHEDYSKPLEVIWLCRIHHMEIHRKFNTIRQQLGLE